MTIRKPDLGRAGRGEIDEPVRPEGLGRRSSASLDARDPTVPGAPPLSPSDPQPLAEPREPQPVAGGVEQPLGVGARDQQVERRRRQEDPERWRREERRGVGGSGR